MTSSHLTGESPGADPVEALRPLVAELRALLGRLELHDENASLAQSLDAAQERVAGPHAVVMLLGEREELKRQFLERLLGADVAQLPSPTAVCTWLEYGDTADCTVTMPLGMTTVIPLAELAAFPGERAMVSIRLPNPTLRGGLALIAAPAAEDGEPDERVLDCMQQADAWIYVLGGDCGLSEAGAAWLGKLPDHGARLEVVVENAGTMGGEERAAAREKLLETLRDRCGIEAPRLTLVSTDGAENGEESVWHGRFATFHSVMALRGREHRLETTRSVVADAFSKAKEEIERELAETSPGPRHARLRMGLKEVEVLSGRFRGEEPSRETEPQTSPGSSRPGAEEAAKHPSPLTVLAEAMATAMAPESAEAAELAAIQPRETAASSPADRAGPKRGISIQLSTGARRFLRDSEFAWWRRAIGIILAILALCLVLWALSPRGFYAREDPGEWDFHPPQPAPPATALVDDAEPARPDIEPGALPADASEPGTSSLHTTPLEKPSAAVRMPLAKPIPSGARAGAAPPRRHHRHLLGLGRLWHWIHPGRTKPTEE